MDQDRRAALAKTGAAVVGTVGLAGCGDILGGGDGNGDGQPPMLPTEPNYGGWLADVSTYDGTVDRRGESDVTVRVGTSGDLGFYKFDPTAVAVSPGTTVTWEWTGRGGAHDVVELNGVFDSGDPVTREGYTFEYTFEAPGVFKYYCTPHREMEMKGAVFVALEE